MYSLSFAHAGSSCHESKEGVLGWSGVRVGGEAGFERRWWRWDGIVSAFEVEHGTVELVLELVSYRELSDGQS